MSTVKRGPASSDALVIFGVTGDLAYKMIFPALYATAKRGARARYSRRTWCADNTLATARNQACRGIPTSSLCAHEASRTISYKRGSWGPKEADALIAADGGWYNSGAADAASD